MDWTFLATAAVGIAGIAGTFWQGKRAREAASNDLKQNLKAASENLLTTINADNERARLAEKRRIYASCLTAINAASPAFSTHRRARNAKNARTWTNVEAKLAAWEDAKTARDAMLNAEMELELIAPKDVFQHAQQAGDNLMKYWDKTANDAEPDDSLPSSTKPLIIKLRSVMRIDLGEPAE
jgi:hypothetical protein